MRTKKAKKFPPIRVTEEAHKKALKVAGNRGESLTDYVSSLIINFHGN